MNGLPRPAACTVIAPLAIFVDAACSELPAMTERVLITAEEFEIPTPANMSIANKAINMTLWDRRTLNSKREFA
jgi:hypothetical protein